MHLYLVRLLLSATLSPSASLRRMIEQLLFGNKIILLGHKRFRKKTATMFIDNNTHNSRFQLR